MQHILYLHQTLLSRVHDRSHLISNQHCLTPLFHPVSVTVRLRPLTALRTIFTHSHLSLSRNTRVSWPQLLVTLLLVHCFSRPYKVVAVKVHFIEQHLCAHCYETASVWFVVFSAERDADRYKKKQTEKSIRRLFLLSAVRIVTQNSWLYSERVF